MGWFIHFVWRYCYGFVSSFRCLVFCRLSFCKVLSCWRYDILLIGWLLSATVFIPIYFSFADVLFPYMFLFPYLYRCNALNSSGDIYGVVLLISFFFYPETDLYTDLMNGTWYFWWSDAWFAWFVFRLPSIFYTVIYGYFPQLGLVDSFINRLVDWSIDPSMFDWLVDRPIDRLTHSLIGWLLAERL